jgi:hypothetical protein
MIAIYRDFWRLNGRLITLYDLTKNELPLPEKLQIEEINVDSMPKLLEWINKDFSFDINVANEPLELFDNDNSQINDYIEKSTNRSIMFIHDNGLLN